MEFLETKEYMTCYRYGPNEFCFANILSLISEACIFRMILHVCIKN